MLADAARARIARLLEQGSVFGVVGTGGHGREVSWIATQCGIAPARQRFIVDPQFIAAPRIGGIEVLTPAQFSQQFPGAPVLVAIGDPRFRRAMVERFVASGHVCPALLSPDASVSPSAQVGEGVFVFPRSVVSVDVTIGDHVHINSLCNVSHDTRIGAFTSLSPGVQVCGAAEIGEGVFLGSNACLINSSSARRIQIGDEALVGAGACVTRPVPAGAKFAGVPARDIG